jgi:hypothetical protein
LDGNKGYTNVRTRDKVDMLVFSFCLTLDVRELKVRSFLLSFPFTS